MAVGSLLLNKPYRVHNEEVYSNLTAAEVTDLVNSDEVHGVHNVNTDIINGFGLHDVTLHQIRVYNAADARSRPSWAAVTAAELSIQADNTLAATKRSTIYNSYLALVTPYLNSLVSGLTNPQIRNVNIFNFYMRTIGLITSGTGEIIGFLPLSQSPVEYHYNMSYNNNDWLVCTLNPNWAAFIA